MKRIKTLYTKIRTKTIYFVDTLVKYGHLRFQGGAWIPVNEYACDYKTIDSRKFIYYWLSRYGLTIDYESFYYIYDSMNCPYYNNEFDIEGKFYISFRVCEDQVEKAEEIIVAISNLIDARHAFKGGIVNDTLTEVYPDNMENVL